MLTIFDQLSHTILPLIGLHMILFSEQLLYFVPNYGKFTVKIYRVDTKKVALLRQPFKQVVRIFFFLLLLENP